MTDATPATGRRAAVTRRRTAIVDDSVVGTVTPMSRTAEKQAERLIERLHGHGALGHDARPETAPSLLADIVTLPTRLPKTRHKLVSRPLDKKGRFKPAQVPGFAQLGWAPGPLEVEIDGVWAFCKPWPDDTPAPVGHGTARYSADGRLSVPGVIRFHLDVEPEDDVLIVVLSHLGEVALVSPNAALMGAPTRIAIPATSAAPEAPAAPPVTLARSATSNPGA